ncbi:phage integrase N-terminal SAM-like domain-containing protein [Crenobacter sp. SG2305]|uniref:phage integrase N-terminal SAM-like domain-containing protein n=1 Tax=Crenobacter oryzisoli TaxID=3056844 RepID=UPI0025AB1676|nr:phage integrase N-terminal SAM-like domain-containing protein [Crenobacter sp. SG2305]MDN0083699.1 phage integrase N-terminal SAM-like domain-containing protein [Crenobacter sp. SG2305]
MASPKLLDQVIDRIRLKHYGLRTEQAYTSWIRQFILFHDRRHPRETGKVEVENLLSYLSLGI